MKRQEAVSTGRTMYPQNVKHPADMHSGSGLLKASGNRKLSSGSWKRGAFKGMPLYSLTLEERATCGPCPAIEVCYGNNMPFAHRAQHGPELERALGVELAQLARKHPSGFSIRLHVLGDFYSLDYVAFWRAMLAKYPMLRVYGYTHRIDAIQDAIHSAWKEYGGRFNILQSDGPGNGRPAAMLETTPGSEKLPLCPQQSGRAASCLDCGVCTNPSIKGVRFAIH